MLAFRLRNSACILSEMVGAAARHCDANSGDGTGRSRNSVAVTDANASSLLQVMELFSCSEKISSDVTEISLHGFPD